MIQDNAAAMDSLADARPMPCALRAWEASEAELRRFLRRQLQGMADPGDCDDLLHDLFLRLLRQGGAFCQVDNARAWLFQVARNLAIDYQRRLRPDSELPEDLPEDVMEVAPIDALARCLPAALAQLSEEDRDILLRCDLEGVPQAEYAEQQSLSLPAAKSRIQRARLRLRQVLLLRFGVRFSPDTGQVCCHVPRVP
ncbi:sigma-70 family RNA polymerase sigma factor [Acidithiobacillus sp. YTS05]|nr:sigma-70 family RNA polymerase sigma factor [Acidithiobacillus sp. YTS05]